MHSIIKDHKSEALSKVKLFFLILSEKSTQWNLSEQKYMRNSLLIHLNENPSRGRWKKPLWAGLCVASNFPPETVWPLWVWEASPSKHTTLSKRGLQGAQHFSLWLKALVSRYWPGGNKTKQVEVFWSPDGLISRPFFYFCGRMTVPCNKICV